jgi:hypothetical protein
MALEFILAQISLFQHNCALCLIKKGEKENMKTKGRCVAKQTRHGRNFWVLIVIVDGIPIQVYRDQSCPGT